MITSILLLVPPVFSSLSVLITTPDNVNNLLTTARLSTQNCYAVHRMFTTTPLIHILSTPYPPLNPCFLRFIHTLQPYPVFTYPPQKNLKKSLTFIYTFLILYTSITIPYLSLTKQWSDHHVHLLQRRTLNLPRAPQEY